MPKAQRAKAKQTRGKQPKTKQVRMVRTRVRQRVAAAMYNVGGMGTAPVAPSDVDEFLAGVTIREFLGVGAGSAQQEEVAELLALRTYEYLENEPGFPKDCELPDSQWLMNNRKLLAESYADEVWKAVSA